MATLQSGLWKRHELFEKNSILLIIGILIVVAIGGLIEIVPLFYLKSTIEKVEGMRPTRRSSSRPQHLHPRGLLPVPQPDGAPDARRGGALRPLLARRRVMYDHPFQWGSKRTGPTWPRVGGKYSDEWHRDHLKNRAAWCRPRSCRPIRSSTAARPGRHRWRPQGEPRRRGPYTDAMIAAAKGDLLAQATPDGPGADAFANRYPNAAVRDFDGDPKRVTEMDALVAYLQMLGTLVDFKLYEAKDKANLR
jgi:cytochrome c oxidase cbb3-type subunit 2